MTFTLAFKLQLDRQGFVPAVQDSAKEVVRFGDLAEAAGEKASAGMRKVGGALDAVTTKFGQLAQRGGDYLQSLARDVTRQFSDIESKATAAGISTKQTAAALRNLPAQMTDVFVGLSSGQSPLTVLIQQGGQVKDMFGGVGNAVRAVGGYLLGLVNPYTVVAAAIAGAALAYHAGAEETVAYNKALILSGNAAGATSDQLAQYARNISQVTGTQGAAAAAVVAVAQSGAVASENLQRAAQAALAFEKATGTAIDTTVKHFQELAKSPLEATLKLNEGMNFLTVSVYEQIKALQEQGKSTEAANLAQKTYADTLSSRSAEILKNVGFIEERWLAVKAAIAGVVDATLNLGREDTASDKINSLNARLVVLKTNLQDYLGKGYGENDRLVAGVRKQIEVVEQMRATVISGSKAQEEAAAKAAADGKKLQARSEFDKLLNQNLSKTAELELKVAAAREIGAAAGKKQHEIESLVAAIRSKNASASGTGESELAGIRGRVAEEKNLIARLQERGAAAQKLTEGEKLVAKIQEELKTSITGVARAQKEKALVAAQELAGLEKVRVEEEKRIKSIQESKEQTLRQIEAVDRSAESIRDQASALQAANAVWGQGKTAVEQMRLAQLEQQLTEAEGSDNFDPKYIAALRNKIAATKDYVAALKEADYKALNDKQVELARATGEQVELARLELSLAGMTSTERARIVAERRVEMELAKRIAEIDRSSLDDEQKRKLTDQARATADEQKYIASAKVVADEWNRVSDQISNSLTDALMRGFESGKGFLRNLRDTAVAMFKSMVLRPTIQAVVQPAAAAVTNALGLGGLGGLGGSGSGVSSTDLFGGVTGIFGRVLPEFTGILSNSFSAAITNLASGNGLAGLTAGLQSAFSIAAEGGIASGAAGALGTIAPYAAVAYAAFQIADKLFGSKGGPKTESGYASADFTSYGFRDSPSSSLVFQHQAGEANMATARTIVDAIRAQYEGTVRALGGIAKQLDAVAFVSTDPQGDAQTQLQIAAAINGQTVYDRRAGGQFENVGRSEEELQSAISSAANRAVLNALMASDIPEKIKNYLGANVDASDLQGVLTTAVQIGQIDEAFRRFGGGLEQIAGLSVEAELGFIRLFGSLDNLSAALSSYDQNYRTEAERTASATQRLAEEFARIGVAMPTTRDGFSALVESQDRTTESGRQTYAALLLVNQAFADVVPAAVAAEEATQALASTTDTLADIARQRQELLQQEQQVMIELVKASGNVDLVRSLELQSIDASNRAIYERVAALNAELAAQQQANDLLAQGKAMELAIYRAMGDTAKVRELELAAMDPSLRALQQLQYELEDLQAAGNGAAAGVSNISQVLQQRQQLEGQLLQATGNVAEIRRRELAALDPANRGLLEHIHAIQDAEEAVRLATEAQQEATQAQQAAISALEQDAQRWLALRDRAGSLLGDINRTLGGSDNRKAELEGIVYGGGDLDERLRAAEELKGLIEQTAQVETQAQQQALANAERMLDVGRSLRDYVQSLRTGGLSALTPTEKVAQATADYQATLAAARGGDTTAQAKLQGVADTLLQLRREYDPGSYSAVFNQITSDLDAFGSALMSEGEQQRALQQEQIDAAQQTNALSQEQIDQLTRLRDAVGGMAATATSGYASSTAQLALANQQLGALGAGVQAAQAALVTAQQAANAYLAALPAVTAEAIANADPVPSILQDMPARIAAALAPLINAANAGGSTASKLSDIDKMYQEELGRNADASGAQFYANSGLSNADIRAQLNASPEGQVADAYRDVMGREPDAAGSAYYTDQVAKGRPIAEVRADLEYSKAHGAHEEGLHRVPFDGYKAVLHADERVLTAGNAARLDAIYSLVEAAARQAPSVTPQFDFSRYQNSQTDALVRPLLAELQALRQQVAKLEATTQQGHTGVAKVTAQIGQQVAGAVATAQTNNARAIELAQRRTVGA